MSTDGTSASVTRIITRGSGSFDTLDALLPANAITSIVGQDSTVYTQYNASTGTGSWRMVIENGNTTQIYWPGSPIPAADSTYTVVYSVVGHISIHGVDYLKSAFCAILRSVYAVQPFFPQYTYTTSDLTTKIGIVESLPERPPKLPTIAVKTGSANMGICTLGEQETLNELRDAEDNIVAYSTWGPLSPTALLEIYALKDSDCRKLTDLTAIFCRDIFRYKLGEYGIGFLDISISAESTISWQGTILHRRTITIPCHTEFTVLYPLDFLDQISRIKLDLVDGDSDTIVNQLDLS